MNRLIPLLISLLIVSCSHYSPIYWGYGEWKVSGISGFDNNSIARLEWAKKPGVITSIDGNSLGGGYKKAKLFPGIHVIDYADYPASFGAHPKGTMEIDFKAGHLYEFNIKYCFWCKPRRYAVWIDDKTTGDVKWGKRPDWPPWFL